MDKKKGGMYLMFGVTKLVLELKAHQLSIWVCSFLSFYQSHGYIVFMRVNYES